MKLLRMSLVHFKRMIKDGKNIGLMFIMPFIVITAINYFNSKDTDVSIVNMAVNIQVEGKSEQKYVSGMLKDLNISKNIFTNNNDKALELLKKNDVVAVYEIPVNFTEKIQQGKKPEIISYKKDNGNGTAPIEGQINQWINKKIKQNILIKNNIIKDENELSKNTVKTIIKSSKKNINNAVLFTVIMVLNFIIFSSLSVGSELIMLKKQKILSRAVTTANKGWEIIGSIYLAFVLTQISIYSVILIMQKLIFGLSFENGFLIFVNMILMSFVAVSIGIFGTRVFKNETVATLVINLLCIVTTFLGMTGMSESMKTSWIMENLSKFTPQYWAFKSIDTLTLIPSAIILLLMSVALFTAGSVKIRSFVDR